MTVELATEAYDRRRHQVSEFSCGRRSLDEWLKRYAGQGERRDTARTFVRANPDSRVLGYYVLLATQVERDDTTAAVAAGTSRRFPIPGVLLARLAVDEQYQGLRLGSALLMDALRRVVIAAEHVAIRAIVVDALDSRAAEFYASFEFEPVTDAPLRLQVPIAAARGIVRAI